MTQQDERARVFDDGKSVPNGTAEEGDGRVHKPKAQDKIVGGIREKGTGGGGKGDGEAGGLSGRQGHDREGRASVNTSGGGKSTKGNGDGDEAGWGWGNRDGGNRREHLDLEKLDGQTRRN